MKAFSKEDLQNMDFEAYLASSSDEEVQETLGFDVGENDDSHSEDEEEKIAKYKVENKNMCQ